MNESERLWRFAEILSHATRVFGSQAEAGQWLGRPAIGLDQRMPIDLLRTHPGARLVAEYLTRIEHGVYTSCRPTCPILDGFDRVLQVRDSRRSDVSFSRSIAVS
jgi:hypothetical protein